MSLTRRARALACLVIVVAPAGCAEDHPMRSGIDAGVRDDGGVIAVDSGPRPDGGVVVDPCASIDCTAMDDMCNTGSCNPVTGTCEATPRADGTACDDGSTCTTGDACMAGTCGGVTVDCSALTDSCNTAACDPSTGMCARAPVADGTTCDDTSACTTGDACMAGACMGAPVDCSALSAGCATGVCNPTTGLCEAATAADGTACDDTNACTMPDVCAGGTCIGTPLPQCNAMCSSATRAVNGTMLPAQDTSFGVDNLTFTGTVCGTSSANNALYYIATIPVGEALTVTATPLSAWNPVIRILPSCGATTCLANSNAGITSQAETLSYVNAGTAPADVIIAVGAATATALGAFDLSVQIGPAPANRVCSAAVPVADGTMLTGQQEALGTDTLTGGTGCGTTTLTRVLYYTATIPAGMRLSVTATPTSWNPAIRLLDRCGAPGCLANASSASTGAAEGLLYTNSSRSDASVIIAIGSASTAIFGNFDLSVRIGPAPYVETSMPTACDDMTAATIAADVTGDDDVGATNALPFTFRIVADAMTHFAISSNGNAQLFTSASTTGSASLSNVAIPSSTAPNGLVSPFWDDLVIPASGNVRTQTFGSAPNRHLTIEWRGLNFFLDASQTITFQAKIYETTNVIEFHYCSAVGASRVTGDSATVGVENATGTDGHQHSFNTAGSVSTMNAIRLTPVP